MLIAVRTEDILFLDIETVPQYSSYALLPDGFRELWDKKASYLTQEAETPADIYCRAGIYAEFGKIICISVGFLVSGGGERIFRVKSFFGENEQQLLSDFALMISRFGAKPNATLCGHNAKEFDFPYISRRMLVNGISLPELLDTAGKKPWEVKLLDTMELWKFGDYKHYTSLNLLAHIFQIPSPKGDIDGSMVAEVYWAQKDIERIVRYCENDVITVLQLFLRYKNQPLLDMSSIQRVQE